MQGACRPRAARLVFREPHALAIAEPIRDRAQVLQCHRIVRVEPQRSLVGDEGMVGDKPPTKSLRVIRQGREVGWGSGGRDVIAG